MSHAGGTVKFKDGLVLHYEYDGTSDVCISKLYDTFDEMWANWRTFPKVECKCEKDEDVTIHSTYGSGFEWEGGACRKCMCITRDLIPKQFQRNDDDYQDGYRWGWCQAIEITFEEAVKKLEEGHDITLKCNTESYEVFLADKSDGFDMEGYISGVLGAKPYDIFSAERILRDSINELSADGKEVVITL
jgi:hypothetical protein